MKIYTQTYDISQPTEQRFWVAPFSNFKIGLKVTDKGEEVLGAISLMAGSTALSAEESEIDGFTIFPTSSTSAGSTTYTISAEGVEQTLSLVQVTTGSTVFDVDEAGSGGGGSAISAFDVSENPVQSKTIVEAALKNHDFLPETIVKYSDGSISAFNIVGTLSNGIIDNFSNVVDIMIGRNVTNIKYNTFSGWVTPNISSISIPNTVVLSTCIVSQDSGSAKLTEDSIFIEEGILSVGSATGLGFISGNKNIHNINFLPKSVKVIGKEAFVAYNAVWGTYGLIGELKIPDTVTYIGQEAFWRNNSLSTVLFGECSQATVYTDAFNGCTGLQNVRIEKRNGVLPIQGSPFADSYPIYVPDELYSTYLGNSNWTQYSSRLKPLSEYYAQNKVTNLSSVSGIMKISQADYDVLSAGGTADASTLYVIV